jgi:hypothetical protein
MQIPLLFRKSVRISAISFMRSRALSPPGTKKINIPRSRAAALLSASPHGTFLTVQQCFSDRLVQHCAGFFFGLLKRGKLPLRHLIFHFSQFGILASQGNLFLLLFNKALVNVLCLFASTWALWFWLIGFIILPFPPQIIN